MTGAAWSVTVTEACAWPVLLAVSVAVKVTVVVPNGNTVGALLLTLTAPSTSSVAVAAFRNCAIATLVAVAPNALKAATVILAGGTTTGGAISRMTTVRDTGVAELPAASLTL